MRRDALERAYRDERAAVLATITRRLDGDLALAEDVVQDAFVAAAVEWDRRGVPDRPGAWLTTTAWRKALDRLRHEKVAAAYAPELVPHVSYDFEGFDASSLEDDQLRMLFTCCHPALAPEARMALTLRSVAGLTVPEIARGVPVDRQRDGAAADAGAQQGLRRADPVPGAERRPARGAARGRAARRLSRLQRGPRAAPGAARGGDPAGAAARAADARRGRGPRAAGAVPAHRRALARAGRGRRAGVAGRAGPRARGTATRSPRACACSSGRCGCRGRVPTRSRPRSPPCTTRRPTSPRPTGRRSPASTSSCCATTRRRWWR